jgi:hypothetical protein
MAWDASRPVPWRRLTKEWAIYAAIMAVLFGLILRSTTAVGSALGLLLSLPVYLAFGAVLAKFGYQRPSLRRRAAATSSRSVSSSAGTSAERNRPAPTRRTTTGPSQHRRRTTKTRRR